MKLQVATMEDLPIVQEMYRDIVQHMNENQYFIWDDVYPCNVFEADIKNHQLYFLKNDASEFVAAFALCARLQEYDGITWKHAQAKALYLDRLGVHVKHLRKGVAQHAISAAIHLAKEKQAEYLRLLVVENNAPAIQLYKKFGFQQAAGKYEEIIDEDLVLQEFGFEISLTSY